MKVSSTINNDDSINEIEHFYKLQLQNYFSVCYFFLCVIFLFFFSGYFIIIIIIIILTKT